MAGASNQSLKAQALAGEVILATPAGLAALKAQIAGLKRQRRDLERIMGERLYDDPDARENPVYNDARTRLNHTLPQQAAEMRRQLTKASEYTEPAIKNKLTFGRVFVLDDGNCYRLAGPLESALLASDRPAYVSYLSPLGRACWEARVGQAIHVGDRVTRIVSLPDA